MRPAPVAARCLALLAVGAAGWLPAAAQEPRAPGPPLAAPAPTDSIPPAPPPRVRDTSDRWIAVDKAQHLTFSLLGTLAGQYVLTTRGGLSDGRALPISAGATLALGLIKEVADSQRARAPHFCWRDLTADAVGVALGALVVGW